MRINEILTESIPSIVDANHIYDLAKKIHRNYNDLGEGDLSDRIFWFEQYKLVDLPLTRLKLKEFYVDDDLVADHVAAIMKSKHTMPPIVFDPIENSIIDGIHRANAYAKLGLDTIPAYVGSVKASHYGEHESSDDDY